MRYSNYLTAHVENISGMIKKNDSLVLGSDPSERMGRYRYWGIAVFHNHRRVLLTHVRILNSDKMVGRIARRIAHLAKLKLEKTVTHLNSKKGEHYHFGMV